MYQPRGVQVISRGMYHVIRRSDILGYVQDWSNAYEKAENICSGRLTRARVMIETQRFCSN